MTTRGFWLLHRYGLCFGKMPEDIGVCVCVLNVTNVLRLTPFEYKPLSNQNLWNKTTVSMLLKGVEGVHMIDILQIVGVCGILLSIPVDSGELCGSYFHL